MRLDVHWEDGAVVNVAVYDVPDDVPDHAVEAAIREAAEAGNATCIAAINAVPRGWLSFVLPRRDGVRLYLDN